MIVGIHGLATRETYCRTTLPPPRWALTPPFHPYPFGRFFSVTLLCPLEHQAVNLLGALCCPDFPPPAGAGSDRADLRGKDTQNLFNSQFSSFPCRIGKERCRTFAIAIRTGFGMSGPRDPSISPRFTRGDSFAVMLSGGPLGPKSKHLDLPEPSPLQYASTVRSQRRTAGAKRLNKKSVPKPRFRHTSL